MAVARLLSADDRLQGKQARWIRRRHLAVGVFQPQFLALVRGHFLGQGLLPSAAL